MMRLHLKIRMVLFINQFRLVRKIDGTVPFLLGHNKIPQIEKCSLKKMLEKQVSMEIERDLNHGKRKLTLQVP